MQAVESETLILYHTDLRGQWPEDSARALAARLPYARRLAVSCGTAAAQASLAGVALALRALGRLLGRRVAAGEFAGAPGEKPRLARSAALVGTAVAGVTRAAASTAAASAEWPDFSIAHSGPWVGCAALARGRVGLDIEMGTDARIADWVVREAALKATGEGLRAVGEVRELELRDTRVHWRGQLWHVQRLELFPGACACALSSVAVRALDVHAVELEELFAP